MILGNQPFQHENILIVPLNNLYVEGDCIITSWGQLAKPLPGQSTSFGVYNEEKGIEWSFDAKGFIQVYTRCDLEHAKAVTHWVFDFVINDKYRRFMPPEKYKFAELAMKGNFKAVFEVMHDLLNDKGIWL